MRSALPARATAERCRIGGEAEIPRRPVLLLAVAVEVEAEIQRLVISRAISGEQIR
jgi:hypothetical protein